MSSLIEFMYQIQWFLWTGAALLVLWVIISKSIERARANKINKSYDKQYGKGKYNVKGITVSYQSLEQLTKNRNIKEIKVTKITR